MDVLQNFLWAFIFSFLGSIPPGTLNLTVLQLGLEKKIQIAWRFAIAAALIEYPYAWLAVVFGELITDSPSILHNLQLIGAVVMTSLGIMNLMSTRKPSVFAQKFQQSGFRRGIALSILNPMILPFWIAITAFLKIEGWVTFSTPLQLHSYLLGIAVGVLVLLMIVTFMAKRLAPAFQQNSRIKFIPGIILLLLGIYAFIKYLF
jgi:threonine/homoserine/homoserine lactone efflux protein